MDLHLTDKVVWVTGASGGIGRAVAELLAEEGALVGLHGSANADALAEWIAEQPWRERAALVRAELTDAEALERAADALRERWGRIDACVANAGLWPPEDRPLHELPIERLRRTIEVDLTGALLTARAFLRTLAATGPRADGLGASLVFTGSTAARFGERGHVDYAAAKSGLSGAMLSLKNEIVALDPAGRVNVVEPGWTMTHMARPALDEPGAPERAVRTMALRRLGHARDVAHAVVWLSSPSAARHVSGQVLTVAGGMEGRVLWETDELAGEEILARTRSAPGSDDTTGTDD